MIRSERNFRLAVWVIRVLVLGSMTVGSIAWNTDERWLGFWCFLLSTLGIPLFLVAGLLLPPEPQRTASGHQIVS